VGDRRGSGEPRTLGLVRAWAVWWGPGGGLKDSIDWEPVPLSQKKKKTKKTRNCKSFRLHSLQFPHSPSSKGLTGGR
jgi:hypothetical protein